MKSPSLHAHPPLPSLSVLLAAIVIIIALIDYQSWFMELLLHRGALPLQFVLTLEAIIFSGLTIVIYRQVSRLLKQFRQSDAEQLSQQALSKREQEVLKKIISGMTNKQIEEQLFIERSTLKSHINRIYKKMDASNREELIQRFSAS